MSPKQASLRSTMFWAVLRVVFVTVMVTLIGFAVSLFVSIAGVLMYSMLRGGGLNLAMAYRNIALPIALVVLAITFFLSLAYEVREFRARRA